MAFTFLGAFSCFLSLKHDEKSSSPSPAEEVLGDKGIIATCKRLAKGAGIDPFPLRKTLRGYNFSKARADSRAAVNVALLDFPQGMAYAMIAGLPVQMGIYCSALASLTGPLLASSRFIMIGPTNATAVLLLSAMVSLNLPAGVTTLQVLPLLLLMVGVFMLIGAFLRVASLVQYISRAVVTGYITAAAMLIIVNQVKQVLQLDIPRAPSFIEVCKLTAAHIHELHWGALLVGVLSLAIYIPAKRYLKALPNVAFTLIVISGLMPLLESWGIQGVAMIDPIPADGWNFSMPHFNFDIMSQMANAAFAVAFLSILESSSIAKTLAARSGDRVNINQQMLSIGFANVINAFGSGMAVSGSLTRSVLNFASGARTPIASMFSGLILIVGLFALGRYIEYIPRPALAALVIAVGISLINREQIRIMMRATHADATAFLVTLISGLLFSLDTAIYLGAAASIILFLHKVSKPDLEEIAFNESGELSAAPQKSKEQKPEISIVHVEGDLFFGSAEIFLDQTRLLVQDDRLKIIILRLRNARHLDATSALAVGDFIRFANKQGSHILVSGVQPAVETVLRRSGMMEVIGEENFFAYVAENPNISTRNALKRAQELLGGQKADITLFAKPKAEDKSGASG